MNLRINISKVAKFVHPLMEIELSIDVMENPTHTYADHREAVSTASPSNDQLSIF